ncbi:transcriptional repressor NrdR [Abditibacteriota bacterium]|nr:transcriptional repressor NrdR [Abditibacteriota bacterium]
MRCPRCQHSDTRVVDSRPIEDGAALRRRRHCESCNERFTTFERLALSPLIVVKRDGRREEFSPEKLRSGLSKACSKRPVATADIERAVGEIEAKLRAEGQSEIAAGRVGELVMETLLALDQVAYVRFASVYQQFDDVTLFAQLLDRMRGRGRKTDE